MRYDIDAPQLEVVAVKQLKPANDHVLLAPFKVPHIVERKSGIIEVHGDNSDDQNLLDKFPLRFGKILAVGENVADYKVGDTVYFHQYSGQDADLSDKNLLQIKQNELWGHAVVETKPYIKINKDKNPPANGGKMGFLQNGNI